ncbi:non-ribosomal peptide synthetase [Paraburkholderia ginsengisoli]|uniref:Non-ribosomal peptide synthetase n=1 Tax=Paraburkholderia ginsengisoli TaxID=311231 RepID=A0A7T4N305_9BURK|nr:non-ribosomal peptide synthetase [Paraburkholderia ginsengisoli]QQC64311.1 non-ribosomal peptide synthetase [Paraburkholderia ginsengisoli]
MENQAKLKTADNRDDIIFPLSELQQAYWIGEEGGLKLSTPAFVYRSYFAPELDLARLTYSLRVILERHPMLRSQITHDGRQVIAESMSVVESETFVTCNDWAEAGAFDPGRMATLDQLAIPQLSDPVKLMCRVHRVNGGFYINLIFRLFSVDGLSIRIVLSELLSLYAGKSLPNPPQSSYRAYLALKETGTRSRDAQASVEYWTRRGAEMPAAPQLPTINPSRFPQQAVFTRRRFALSVEQSQDLALQARRCGVSLTQFICVAYIDILRMWSENKTFVLNVLTSKRPLDDNSFRYSVGNFSDTLLLEAAPCDGSFRSRAGAVRSQFLTAMEHSDIGGVAILRHLGMTSGDYPVLPVVFASTLGSESLLQECSLPDLGWTDQLGALNTPQVYLDHQVSMADGRIVLNWDSVDAVFHAGVIEQMFSAYKSHVFALTSTSDLAEQSCLPALDEQHVEPRTRANATECIFPNDRLDALFDSAATKFPHNAAVVCEERTIDYATLHRATTRAAHRLVRHGVAPGTLVAIVSEKSWQQVAAAVSIVKSGGAYLPLSANLPRPRLAHLLATEGLKIILADRASIDKIEAPAGVTVFSIEEFFDSRESERVDTDNVPREKRTDDLAYVIFTSGSTGLPKGVAITHRAAANTIHDCIRRFRLTADDRVIGVSALNFDLSVFDIFATLASGAALVLPSHGEHPSPEAWVRCFRDHKVTVWNTVPALFAMLLEFTQAGHRALLNSLRLVMLSGDWIPLPLVNAIQSLEHTPTLIGLGGATEAAIWSNFFPIQNLDPAWTSVPYGWPLSNQQYHVLDENLNDVPTWVSGQLHISGLGLAREYYGDIDRTHASFITHPSGLRMYRTGDYGRYLPDGSLEFLGRRDAQVKIRGHRIGLGEIDAVLSSIPGIQQSLTLVQDLANSDSRLVSFCQGASESEHLNIDGLRAELGDRLPHYMVPNLLLEIRQFPVTVNGKIDKQALLALAHSSPADMAAKLLPSDETEQELLDLWESVLQVEVTYVNRDFFDLGGNSLSAVRLLTKINVHFNVNMQLSSLLRLGTIAEQAKAIQTLPLEHSSVNDIPAVIRMARGDGPVLLAIHPVGGNVLCYRPLTALLPDGVAMFAFQSPGDGRPRSVESLARTYAREFSRTQLGARPVYVIGWSMGGIVALEVARVLEEEGTDVTSVTLLDSWSGGKPGVDATELNAPQFLHGFFRDLLGGADPGIDMELIASLPASLRVREISDLASRKHPALHGMSAEDLADLFAEYTANYDALLLHRPLLPSAPIINYVATRTSDFKILKRCDLNDLASLRNLRLRATTIHVDEDHHSIVGPGSMRHVLDTIFNQ